MKYIIRVLIIVILTTLLFNCSQNTRPKGMPSVDSSINIDGQAAEITSTFNFKYKDSNYYLAVARSDNQDIHFIVYEVLKDSCLITDKLFPKEEFKYPNGSVQAGSFKLYRNNLGFPYVPGLEKFEEQIEFNSKTRIITYNEFFCDKDGHIVPTGKSISWELKEY